PSHKTTATTQPAWLAHWPTGLPKLSASSICPTPPRWFRLKETTMMLRIRHLSLAGLLGASLSLTAQAADNAALLQQGKALTATCVACHTPPEAMAAGKGMDDSSPEFLAGGGVFQGWVAPSLRGDVGTGLGTWSVEDIVATLKTG